MEDFWKFRRGDDTEAPTRDERWVLDTTNQTNIGVARATGTSVKYSN